MRSHPNWLIPIATVQLRRRPERRGQVSLLPGSTGGHRLVIGNGSGLEPEPCPKPGSSKKCHLALSLIVVSCFEALVFSLRNSKLLIPPNTSTVG